MKILFITPDTSKKIRSDFMSDGLLHGLREQYGENVIDYPGSWYMYKDEVKKRNFDFSNFWGNGFTFYDELENFDQFDRANIQDKIKKNYFNYIIYGSFTRSKFFLEEAKKSNSKIILIDGEDNIDLSQNLDIKIAYFKRELVKDITNVFPINFSIPEKKIVTNINLNPENLLAPLIPHRYKTYIYKNQNDYYKMWQNSIIGISYVWGGWWDALRYYEMLMNGCVPLIQNLENCPKNSLYFLPKKDLLETKKNYSWILSQYNPFRIYKKKFLNFKKLSLFLSSSFKKKYNAEEFIQNFPEINILRSNLLEYTKKFLTTKAMSKYIIDKSNRFYNE
tara:strand:- start:53 stop:1057 length:1005 start_codon:yes stop_codon:yes gene_type:complete